ncbi:MAG: hypothetical protein KatS3mg067_2031 [Thermosynechococcus sp.]|nr:MAG: hypothetical protein KatS3mg067_2031 [Thermosynechococcus sp.]
MGCIEEFIQQTAEQKTHPVFVQGWQKLALNK